VSPLTGQPLSPPPAHRAGYAHPRPATLAEVPTAPIPRQKSVETVTFPAAGTPFAPAESQEAGRGGDGGEAEQGPERPLNRKRIVIVGAAAAVVMAVAGFTAYVYGGDVPRGSRVLGVELGGMSRSDAERALTDAFGARTSAAVKVELDGTATTVLPADVGMSFDVVRTVSRAMEGSPSIFKDRDVEPIIAVDQERLRAKLMAQLDPAKLTMKKPGISFSGTTPKATYPQAGRVLDPAVAAEAVKAAWLPGGTAAVKLVEKPAATSKAEVDRMIADLAKPAVASGVKVSVDGKSFTLPPQALAKGLVFRSDDAGKLTASVDGAKLHAAAEREFGKVETEPTPATVKLSGGKPKIVEAKGGDMVDLTALGKALLPVLAESSGREVPATLVHKDADVTADDIEKLGIKEKVSSFTTRFTGGSSSPRSQNIMTIARQVDGALVKPGATFSLNKHTGERDYAAGYQDAPVIVGGKLEPGVAGGASQFTTTLFNASYYAGLQDVEHKPHSFYFDRYPSVIESTIFYPSLDLRFKNTTPHGILIDTSYTSSSVTVTMWSTKVYDSVKTVYGPRRDITSPPTEHREPGPKCISSSGLPGFTQDAWRVIRKDGKEVKREKFSWRYAPEPRFVCQEE
jgi:vancomycin resistance protein YoaR